MLEGGTGTTLIEVAPSVPRWAVSLASDSSVAREIRLDGVGRSCVVETATGRGAALVSCCVARANTLSADELRRAVSGMFLAALDALRGTEGACPVRMWSFIPGIHDLMRDAGGGELERYEVFNVGRFEAFCEWYGGPGAFASRLPAASAVGHSGDALSIYALGTMTAGRAIDNPRQVPAYCYSRRYGSHPPCFARATVARLSVGARLLVAGTASILGERSVHEGCLGTQLDESLENIGVLARSVDGAHRFDLSGVETARVYYPRAADLGWLSARLPARLPARASIEYTPAAVCRSELLVEIEATVAPVDS